MIYTLKQYKILFFAMMVTNLDIPSANEINEKQKVNKEESKCTERFGINLCENIGHTTLLIVNENKDTNNLIRTHNNEKLSPLELNTKLNKIGFPELYDKIIKYLPLLKITGDNLLNSVVKIDNTIIAKNGKIITQQLNKFN